EDVDVLEPHASQALIEAREQVLARAEVAVRPGPHVVPGLRGDDELVAVGREVVAQDPAERLLGGTVGRAVVVREVEVRAAAVEGAAGHGAAAVERHGAAEVVTQSERHGGKRKAAAPDAAILHPSIAVLRGDVSHGATTPENARSWHAGGRPNQSERVPGGG